MENINISLGIELDKKQFNDNYIQGEVDKAVSDITVKVNNVKVGDVTKSLQNDIDKQAGNLNVQIKGVSIDKSEAQAVVERMANDIQKTLDKLPAEQKLKLVAEGGIFDMNAIRKELTNGVKNAISESMEEFELDFDKISVTGGKKAAESLVNILNEDFGSIGDSLTEELDNSIRKFTDSISASDRKKLINEILGEREEEVKALGRKYGLEFSNEMAKQIAAKATSILGSNYPYDVMEELGMPNNKELEKDLFGIMKLLGDIEEKANSVTLGSTDNIKHFEELSKKIEDISKGTYIFKEDLANNVQSVVQHIIEDISALDSKIKNFGISDSIFDEYEDKANKIIAKIEDLELSDLKVDSSQLDDLYTKIDKVRNKLQEFRDEDELYDSSFQIEEFKRIEQAVRSLESSISYTTEIANDVGYSGLVEYQKEIDSLKDNLYSLLEEDYYGRMSSDIYDTISKLKELDDVVMNQRTLMSNEYSGVFDESSIKSWKYILNNINNEMAKIKEGFANISTLDSKSIDEYSKKIRNLKTDFDEVALLDVVLNTTDVNKAKDELESLSDTFKVLYENSLYKNSLGDDSVYNELYQDFTRLRREAEDLKGAVSQIDISLGETSYYDLTTYIDELDKLRSNLRNLSLEDHTLTLEVGIDDAVKEIDYVKDNINKIIQSASDFDFSSVSEEFGELKSEVNKFYDILNDGDPDTEQLETLNEIADEIRKSFEDITDTAQYGYSEMSIVIDKLLTDIDVANDKLRDFADESYIDEMFSSKELKSSVSNIKEEVSELGDKVNSIRFDSDGFNADVLNESLLQINDIYDKLDNIKNESYSQGLFEEYYEDISKLQTELLNMGRTLNDISDRELSLKDDYKIQPKKTPLLTVSEADFADVDRIRTQLQQTLYSISEDLSILIEKVYLYHESSALVNDLNKDIVQLGDKLNPLELNISLPEEFKTQIQSDIENLFDNIKPIFERLQNEFKVSASKLEEDFKSATDKITTYLTALFSKQISFDFKKAKLIGLKDKFKEIEKDLALKVNTIDLNKTAKQQKDIQSQLNSFTSNIELQIGKVKLLSIGKEIQSGLNAISGDLKVNVKNTNTNSKKVTEEKFEPITPKDARSMIAKINKEYNDVIDSLVDDFMKSNSLKGLKGKIKSAIKSDTTSSDDIISEVVKAAEKSLKGDKSAGKEESKYTSEIIDKYNQLTQAIKEVQVARDSGVNSVNKQLEESKRLSEDITNGVKANTAELQKYNGELDKITKQSETYIEGIKKEASRTTANLGETTTVTTKFNVDETTTTIEKTVKDIKSFNKEIDSAEKKLKSLNNIEPDVITKMTDELKKFKIGDSVDAFDRFKKEVEELSNLDEKIKNVNESISNLNKELKESKIDSYIDKAVFKDIQKSINKITTDTAEEEIKNLFNRIKELKSVKNDIISIDKAINDLARDLTSISGGTGNSGLSYLENIDDVVKLHGELQELNEIKNRLESGEFIGADVQKRIASVTSSMKDLKAAISQTSKELTQTEKSNKQLETLSIKQEELSKRLKQLFADGYIDANQFEKLEDKINDLDVEHLAKGIFDIKSEFERLVTSASSIDRVVKNISELERSIDKAAAKKLNVVDSNDAVKELNNVISKIKELESLRDKINSGEDIGVAKINKVYVGARNAVQDYKDVLTELSNNAKKTESQLNKLSNTIEELNYKTAKAEGKNSDIADFSVVINSLSKYEEKLKELDSIQSKVINGEDVSDNVIEKAITNAKRETENYIETLKLANTHGVKFEETFNRLSKISTDRAALGLDTEIINKFNSELFNLPQGADESNKKFIEINNSLSIMEDNIKKISSLKNVLKDIESNISDLTTKKNDGIISDSEARKLEDIKGIAANLTKTIQDLSNNAEIGNVKFEQLSTAAKNSIKNVEGLGDAQARLSSKLREMQVEEIVDSEQFDDLQRRINNISAKKLKSEVNSIEKEFEYLIKNSKQLDTISKAIDKATESIEQANADNFEIINSEKAIDEIESLMSVFSNKLTDLYELQNKISQGELIGNKAINRAIEGINKIADTYKNTLSSLSSNTNLFNEISKKLQISLSDKAILGLDDSYVRGLIEELNNIDLSSNEAKDSLNRLNDTVQNLGKSDKDIQKLQGVIKQLEDTISRINDRKNLGIVTESDLRKMEEMKSHVANLNGVIDKLNNGIDVTQIEIKDLETAAKNSMKNISTVAESTRNSFANLGISLNRAMEFAIGDNIGDMISYQFRMAKDTILEIDNSMRDLRRVTDLSEEGYENFTKSANETAMALGRTTSETINATTEFVKLGYSVEQAEGFLSKAGLTLANVADMETGDAIAAITSTLKGFGIEVEQVTRVIDVMNESGNKYALNSRDLAEMLRIASASMSIAGNDLEQTSALMIGAFEILRDSSKVANGLKTISMRLRGVAEEGEELNPKLGELVKTLTGVDLTDANGEFRNTYDILTEIGEQFDGLNSKEQALLLEEIAGKNQANVLAAMFKNLQQIPEAYETLQKAAGSAAREQEAYMESLSGKINKLKENIAGIWIDLVDRGAAGDAIDSLNSVVSAFRGLSNTFGSLPTLVGIGTLAFTTFSAKGREMASTLRGNVVGGLSLMSNTVNDVATKISDLKGKLEEKIRTLKEEIVATKESITKNRANGESIDGLRGKLVGLAAKQGVATAGMIAMKAATIALQGALTMGLSMLTTYIVQGLSKLIDKMIITKSELKELNEEFRSDEEVSKIANTNKLISSYEELSNKLKTVTEGSSEYRDIKNELSEVEKQLLELYPKAKAGIDAETGATKLNIEAVKELTDEQYNLAKAKALANLKDNKLTGLESANKIRQELNDLKDYQIKLEAIADIAEKGMRSTTVELSSGKNVKVYADDLKKITKKYEEQKEKVETLASSTQILGRENEKYAAVAKEITSVLDEMNGVAKESIDTSGVNAGTDALELMGNAAEETKSSIDDLGDAFNNLKSPLDLLNTMMKEFSEYGGLTDETYSKVLTSENLDLIALLANSENFMQSAEELRQKYLSGLDETAKSIIAFAVGSSDAMQDGAKVIDSSNQRIIDSLNERLETIEDISEEERNVIEGQIETLEKLALTDIGGEGYSQLMYNLMESMKLAGDEATKLEVLMTQGIVDYVNNGGQLYAQDAQNKEAFDEAKANSSEILASNELSILANQILAKEGQYSQDVVNWANAIANKTYDSATFTDEVLIQIANMVLLNAENYSQDTVNWAMAITNKNQNHVNMVNNILKNVAEMILANAKNYNIDTVNWANAIINKDKNNADLCNSITNNMAGVINTLSQQYASDDTNFRNLMLSKKNYLNAFNSWYKNNGGTDKSYDRMSIAQAEALEKQFKKETGIQLGGQGELNLGGGFKPVSVSGGNYVGNVGSAADLKDKGSSAKKDIEDLKDVIDRYYDLNNALQKIENEISAIDTELDSKTGKDRIALIEKEIKLLDDKRTALINIRNEQNRELSELRSALSGKGFSFAADGQIANYHAQLNNLVASANSQTGEAKEQAIANVKDVISQIEKYTDLLLSDIPDITNQINSITGSVSDLREEIDQIIKDTTFFTKDFIDRYYELNNALKQVENQLNAISVAIKNADDNKMIELLDKQIELYIKQGEALAELRKENIKELNELGKELYDAGFKFNQDGTLSNYQSLIDKMVQDANKITDGKKQEKAIERIEELIETIEKYTGLLLDDIPDITNDMDDLANSVIDSQNKIADILSKQKDEYIENLKKETEALKQEVERRKEILQKQWEQEDAADELAEKQQKLNELEDQLTLALRTGDEELIKNIREQITAAQKEINDFIRDEERDYISDRFDEDLDKLDEDLNNKIDKINESLSDKELLNLVQSGVRDLTEVLNNIENGSKGVRSAFAAIGTTISETWINALDTFVDKLNGLQNVNLGFNLESKLSKFIDGVSRTLNINQGNLIVQGNITEDVLPIVQGMIDTANNNLIRDINAAFSR